jgi:hypothetical protein
LKARFIDRLTDRPERNVGHSDFITRGVASIVLAGLIVLMLPVAKVPFPLIKISLLTAAELGLITLMLGLFLRTKTHFSGLQLFATPLLMFRLAAWDVPYVAAGVGLLSLVIGIMNLVTRRSRFNQVLNLSSLREVIEVVAPEPRKTPTADSGLRS